MMAVATGKRCGGLLEYALVPIGWGDLRSKNIVYCSSLGLLVLDQKYGR